MVICGGMAGAFVDQARGVLVKPAKAFAFVLVSLIGTLAALTKKVPPSPCELGYTTTEAPSFARNERKRVWGGNRPPRGPPRPSGPEPVAVRLVPTSSELVDERNARRGNPPPSAPSTTLPVIVAVLRSPALASWSRLVS